MDYRLVCDVRHAAPAWSFPATGLVLVAVALFLWRLRDRESAFWQGVFRTRPGLRRKFCLFLLVCSLLWTAIASIAVFGSHFGAQRALDDGTAQVVEGPVESFHAMPYSGHDTERFTVGGVRFEYSDYIVTGGFNQASSHGGPVHAGLVVRIHYARRDDGPVILKMEVKQ